MYMLFTVVGSLFIIVLGLGVAYELLWLDDEDAEELEGHPIMYNLTGHIVPVVSFVHLVLSLFSCFETFSEKKTIRMDSPF